LSGEIAKRGLAVSLRPSTFFKAPRRGRAALKRELALHPHAVREAIQQIHWRQKSQRFQSWSVVASSALSFVKRDWRALDGRWPVGHPARAV